MKMLQILKWKYAGDPRATQYREFLKDYHLLSDRKRDKNELKQILVFLAAEYKKAVGTDKFPQVIVDIDTYYRYLSITEQAEYQKLIEKMETK